MELYYKRVWNNSEIPPTQVVLSSNNPYVPSKFVGN